jgi:hypothetical protein
VPSNINIQNNVNSLSLATAMGGGLGSDDYQIATNSAPSMQFTNYLSFNRNEGVKDGQTYTFTTQFALGTITFTIQISLTGTFSSSNYWIQLTVDNGNSSTSTGAISDVGNTSLNASNDGGALAVGLLDGETLYYSVSVTRFLNGSYDDVTITISPVNQVCNANLPLPPYTEATHIPLLDVWGEGRIVTDSMTTGFTQAYNLNNAGQLITNGPDDGEPVPNLVPVSSQNSPVFPLPDGIVAFETLMGAPIIAQTATEMVRVLNPQTGVVILYDPNPADLGVWEANMGNLVAKPTDTLHAPFDQISITPALVYGFPNVTDHDEL